MLLFHRTKLKSLNLQAQYYYGGECLLMLVKEEVVDNCCTITTNCVHYESMSVHIV